MSIIKTPTDMHTFLSDSKRNKIRKHIRNKELDDIINILDKVSTSHAGTAKTKDKRFVINELVKYIQDNYSDMERVFFNYGKHLCGVDSDNAKEVGISLICAATGRIR